ncbi:aspartate--tRNA ligase [Candidatus Peregrinibacteria bacterium CG22_combo_CG10-13_8_21_14_all_44_10]|nr:MAG: aspartate--tRNA ligase [Candidatus Peregrinibacteria bacterium CG2_30_44_17]PIP66093.1 MAG: aspartate--tRNA ligase [Candidatus Peregrinibacteria bacterium CG22_combo_CG10-13_8_21_14_all_44_10]PIS04350.1 MAG: aspartate--tRNA ligase [Candidatus Peregrinibacteria bacterium CG10_big_fil_rev_8_21_14_0_10_44_7]PIX80362.1 MAG: aspartate--tRNA ligase [Candidatus Peregrinibacteria bacterium CG_4_10_14_3_um_filter_44_21]PJB89414.1 MAG: aspartate--tRNA ligase [Candidatus Peregrinibacteria bacteriu
MYRTHTCGKLTTTDVGQEVTLSGWVHRRRDHGGLIFIDLRDRYGITQVVFDPSGNKDAHISAESIRSEFVITIKGVVRGRPEGQSNKEMSTGEIEVLADFIEILSRAQTPPFEIDQDKEVGEDVRLKYRYLDLRRQRMKKNIELRHRVIKSIRDFLDKEEFLEIETPILIKGTPEGSREYIVPSRIYPGTFFVLPQSPQQLKQLLMVAGMDKYFQIARCFRDEDQRGDRQPEFTQLDLEMSFIDEDDIMNLNERLLIKLLTDNVPNKEILKTPVPKLTWHDAMSKYGSDKPDLRFEMPLSDVSDIVSNSEFKVFSGTIQHGGVVKCLRVSNGADMPRSETDSYEELAKSYGAKGLAYLSWKDGEVKGPIAKFLSEDELKRIQERTEAVEGDNVFFMADRFDLACNVLGAVRLKIADKLGLRDDSKLALCWIVDFPMFELDEETGNFSAAHHPFTSPKHEDAELLTTDPAKARSKAYDLVMNGVEIAGGSIRIHDAALQSKVFDALGISKEDAKLRFGHMLEAFSYGAPPHGGIAWGLDRFIMLLADEPNIREVIAFPKDQKAKDIMTGAPTELPAEQVAEMHIKVSLPKA